MLPCREMTILSMAEQGQTLASSLSANCNDHYYRTDRPGAGRVEDHPAGWHSIALQWDA